MYPAQLVHVLPDGKKSGHRGRPDRFRKHDSVPVRDAEEFFRFRSIGGKRFFEQHVLSALKKALRLRKMKRIWRSNVNRIHGIVGSHFFDACKDAGSAVLFRKRSPALRIPRTDRRKSKPLTVQSGHQKLMGNVSGSDRAETDLPSGIVHSFLLPAGRHALSPLSSDPGYARDRYIFKTNHCGHHH